MSNMENKKQYVWDIAKFLHRQNITMSGKELANHLNRNKYLTESGRKYSGGRGTYTLINVTWRWVNNELKLADEAGKIARAFVKLDGTYAYE
jgi:hypothetical protein